MNISQFKASINQRGMLHNTDYEARITPPLGLVRVGIGTEEMTLRATSVDMPGRSIQTVPNRNAVGPERQIGYSGSHIPINMTFLADNRHFIKRILEGWQDLAIGNYRSRPNERSSSKFNLGYYEDYIGTVEIIQFDREYKTPIYTCKLLECYPVTINPIDLSWSAVDRAMEISVTWMYRYFENSDNFSEAVDTVRNRSLSADPRTADQPGQSLPDSF